MKLIAGIARFDGETSGEETLQRMLASMIGPGLQPAFHVTRTASAMLGTLTFGPRAEENDSVPALRASGGALAADLRLDGTGSLEGSLNGAGWTETRYVESLLDAGGPLGLRDLLGDFAIANWDERGQALLLARDGMGVRPLVYHYRPGAYLVFASFPRAVHASGLLERRVDTASLAREMVGRSRPEDTLFEGVRSVAPGHALVFSTTRKQATGFWKPERQSRRYTDAAEAAEAMRTAVEAAVASRSTGTLPLAAHLSGGLDSSAIAVMAGRRLAREGRSLLCYSFVEVERGKGVRTDERPYVEAVLQQEPALDWTPVSQTGTMERQELKEDRVLSDSADSPDNVVCSLAAARGAQLVLSGWGGDEGATYNGRGVLANALLTLKPGYLAKETRALERVRGFSPLQTIRGEIVPYLVPSWLRRVIRRPGLGLASLLAPGLQRLAGAAHGRVGQSQVALLRGNHLAFRMSDWAEIGARYGMAFTFPLLDRRVIECALSIQGSLYLRDGWKRRPFRDAMEGILPEKIRWRHDKLTPFADSFKRLSLQRDGLRLEVDALLKKPAVAAVFDVGQVRRCLDRLPTPFELIRDASRQVDLIAVITLLNYAQFLARETSVASTKLITAPAANHPGRLEHA